MAVQIRIDQVGKPAGVAGQAREDLDLATEVVLTATGGPFSLYQWTIIDKPPNEAMTAASGSVLTTPSSNASGVVPDNRGTYLVELQVDSGFGLGARTEDRTRITFYAGPALNPVPNQFPRRRLAAHEEDEHNVPDAIEPDGNTDGWAREMERWFRVIEARRPVVTIDPAASYSPTAAAGKEGGHREHTHAVGPITVTLPSDATEALPVGYGETGAQASAQPVSIVPGAGATIENGTTVVTDASNRVYGYIKIAANTWRAFGGA